MLALIAKEKDTNFFPISCPEQELTLSLIGVAIAIGIGIDLLFLPTIPKAIPIPTSTNQDKPMDYCPETTGIVENRLQ